MKPKRKYVCVACIWYSFFKFFFLFSFIIIGKRRFDRAYLVMCAVVYFIQCVKNAHCSRIGYSKN